MLDAFDENLLWFLLDFGCPFLCAIKTFKAVPISATPEPEFQAVWLSKEYDLNDIDATESTKILPSYTRLLDWSDDFDDRALLSTITEKDLQNTDIYLIRESDGTLITERRGLKHKASGRSGNLSTWDGEVKYTMQVINGYESHNRAGYASSFFGFRDNFKSWQVKSNMNPKFYEKNADHLRIGEMVRIVAINRPTGYMGSTRVEVKAAGSEEISQLLSFNIPKIIMRPPNLKIWARRQTDIGTKRGEDGIQQIGSEGAALSNDKVIIISTEWVDHDGSPLPAVLDDYGFTGRLAKVSASNTLTSKSGVSSNGSRLSNFVIKPGRQTQVIRLEEGNLGTEHLYVHVSGEPQKRRPDLSGKFNSDSSKYPKGSILQYRPAIFVPVQVPVYDEKNTKISMDAWKQAKKNNPSLKKPEPTYRWVYRPEFQFSVYDLEIDKIIRHPFEQEEVDIYISDNPAISASDDTLKILYNLTSSTHDALEAYSYNNDRELVFSLAGNEVKATLGSNKDCTPPATDCVIFDRLDYLALLESEDLLTIKLFSNNDAANVLWEFDFTPLQIDIAVDLNRDGKIEFEDQHSWTEIQSYLSGTGDKKPKDRTYTKEKDGIESHILPYRFWINNDYDIVNDRGNVILDAISCEGLNPPITNEEYIQTCEQWDGDAVAGRFTNASFANLAKIESFRDLEDFSPLKIIIDKKRVKDYKVSLKASGININLFKGAWKDEDNKKANEYIFDEVATKQQIAEANNHHNIRVVSVSDAYTFSEEDLNTFFDEDGVGRFIFEGIDTQLTDNTNCKETPKQCYLAIRYLNSDNEVVVEKKIFFDLHDIKDFYLHVSAGTAHSILDEIWSLEDYNADYQQSISIKHTIKTDIFHDLIPETIINNDLTMLVHGWRMRDSEKKNFAETSYKRLYWSGYQGRFGTFSWPTGWFNKPAHLYGFISLLPYVTLNGLNYDTSEFVARRVGVSLATFLLTDFQVKSGTSPISYKSIENQHFIVHSMGNIVVSEAIRSHLGKGLGTPLFTSYLPSQAAEAAGAYNTNHPNIVHHFLPDWAAPVGCGLPDRPSHEENIPNGYTPEKAWRCYNIDSLTNSEYDMPPDINRLTFNTVLNEGVKRLEHGKTSDSATTSLIVNSKDVNYYRHLNQGVERIVNYYNPKDAALSAWEFNQLNKPDSYTNYFLLGTTRYYHNEVIDSPLPILPEVVHSRFVKRKLALYHELFWNQTLTKDSAEILSYFIPARTKALGQSALTQMGKNIRLQGFVDSNQDHSGEFHGYLSEKRSDFSFRANYWNKILSQGIKLSHDLASGYKRY